MSSMESINLSLYTTDGKMFVVTAKQAQRSSVLKTMLETLNINAGDDIRLEEPMPVNVRSPVFEKICDWLKSVEDQEPRARNPDGPIVLTEEDKSFCSGNAFGFLLETMMGANYLDIQELVDIVSQFIADLANGMSIETMRSTFGLENDIPVEVQKQLQQRFAWLESIDD